MLNTPTTEYSRSLSDKPFLQSSSPLENLILDDLYHAVFSADIKKVLTLLERQSDEKNTTASLKLAKFETYIALASQQGHESIHGLLQAFRQIDAEDIKLCRSQILLLLLACIVHNTPKVFGKLLQFFSKATMLFSDKEKLPLFQLSIALNRQIFSDKLIAWNILPPPQTICIAYKYRVSHNFMMMLWQAFEDHQKKMLLKNYFLKARILGLSKVIYHPIW